MTADPLAFLRDALDAAQARAEAAGGDEWSAQEHPADTVAVYDSKRDPVVYDESLPTPEQVAHIVANSPTAVLRRIAADREILAACQAVLHDARDDYTADNLAEKTIHRLAEGWGWTGETT